MYILGIDTSCDDTCISVLETNNSKPSKGKGKFKIISNIVSSQVEIHAKYGGVYPFLAKREHQKNLPLVFKNALGKIKEKEIDCIAVTVGPGLEPCLWTGINFAKELSERLNKPLILINHIEGHILSNFINLDFNRVFPAVCLIVSGGHTELVLMKKIGKYELIGETRDDAAGECFDKVARILGLGYPGGPAISIEAENFKNKELVSNISLPRPMINHKNYDFSFSGLKTAVLYQVQSAKNKARSKKYIEEMCHEAQQSIIDVLIKKTLKAAKEYRAKSIIVGGGVIANKELRKQLGNKIKNELPNIKYYIPESIYCMDNGAMIAATAFFRLKDKKNKNLKTITADANLKINE